MRNEFAWDDEMDSIEDYMEIKHMDDIFDYFEDHIDYQENSGNHTSWEL